ncbi:hypothetical protein NDR87_09070 [Nocardia sp. CDC159]|uniref:Lipoprotein n=1 Tax=Nocardia pulmonis TaxID=2951408 RepID=A0A9X2IVV5_9NOCA|nr:MULTISPECIES: hypothetical protein [Nocardia]MCM6773618.1 hypothetical protein [Nocardia pulmonis]MCM6786505.1 hypothetical protein [Nocardia sp. CDC159]
MRVFGRYLAVLAVSVLAVAGCGSRPPAEAPFHFQVTEGQNLNYFLRDGRTAAHLILGAGHDPRILVAFPAGNSGTGAWFESTAEGVRWQLDAPPKAESDRDARGRELNGIVFDASIATPTLVPKQAVLSNVRVLRTYGEDRKPVPTEVLTPPTVFGKSVTWARDRLDGAPGYRLSLEVTAGTVLDGGAVTAGPDGRIGLRVTALTGETPLTPLAGAELFNGNERALEGPKNTLTFLSYREKFLAGSWRFDTYFGRDTLLSLMMLMPVLAPEATEAGLRSVLTRLAPDGAVAHEESVSEFAILTRLRQDGSRGDAPIYDYNMVDESYLLAPVAAAYLLDSDRAGEFLRAEAAPGVSNGQALVRNLRLVVATAEPFARDPRYTNLIGLKPGHNAGEWRDSETGLGGGRYPYNVGAILVPAALEATARLLDSGRLDGYLGDDDRLELSFAAAHAKVWRSEAARLFTVRLDNAAARAAVESYAQSVGVPAAAALAALASGPVTFPAVALDAEGRPIPILHSDDVFDLLLGESPPEALDAAVATMIRPFPLGLMTGAGPVVANPVFADPGLRAQFTTHHYHGTVVWSWQQAAFAAGLQRQLQRTDLPPPIRDRLVDAQRTLWRVIDATAAMHSSELWSWRYDNGGYHITPFGAAAADVTESNAAQLWSSAYLAIRPPAP